jgi:hypothetical protein
VSALRRKRLVREAEFDFGGGHWHNHRFVSPEHRQHYFWSVLASTLPQYAYDYAIYREAAENYNRKVNPHAQVGPHEEVGILGLEDFVRVLAFREKELLRLIAAWSQGWNEFSKANEWHWPKEWGDLQWNCPILRDRASLLAAEQDLMETRAALERHRRNLSPMSTTFEPSNNATNG